MTENVMSNRRYSRRALLRNAVGMAAVSASGALLAACGGGTAATSTAGQTVAAKPTSAPAATGVAATSVPVTSAGAAPTGTSAVGSAAASPSAAVDGKIPSPNPQAGIPDAFTKLPPPFTSVANPPGKGGRVTMFNITYDPPISAKGDNKFWQELEKRLGVTWDVTLAPRADYEAKFATVLASGDLPDLIFLTPPPGWEKAALQGAFADLTPYLTGAGLKEFPNLAVFPPVQWKNVALNKKIYGVPRPRFLANDADYFRQDWADKVGLGHPKNADEFTQMLVAFTKNDPDGNGKPDTYGISSKTPRPAFEIGDTSGTIGQMFRFPNGWRLNSDGTLTATFETEEYKAALAYTAKLWQMGVWYPDSATVSTTQDKDLFYASKIGMYNDGLAGLMGTQGARGKTRALTPTANVTAFIPPGHDGGKPTYQKYRGHFGFTAISSKNAKDESRVRELLGILNYFAAPFGSQEWLFNTYGIVGVDSQVKNGFPTLTDRGKSEISALVTLANAPPVAYYDEPGDAQDMQKIQVDLLATGVDDPTWGLYSPTFAAKEAELAQLESDRRLAIVLGRSPLTAWDDFIKEWRSRGGDQIRKEYESALKG
ncbi:MAG: extracellular solute-binding protein [Thermomicrobiales bacterium]